MSAAADATAPETSARPPVLRTDHDGVATVTLNRPAARNALSMALMTVLQEVFEAIDRDRSVRAVVLAAHGPAFCAGHDLKELSADRDPTALARVFRTCSALMLTIQQIRQPVIAQVQGIATAAGCQLVATCDLALAAEDARFATPGVNIGLFCSTPMVALSRAVGRKAALEMLLLGEMIDAGEAVRIGLVNRAVPAAELDRATAALAGKIAAKSGRVLEIGKSAFYRQIELGTKAAYDEMSEIMTRNMLARDAGEGIGAFLGKRAPEWHHQ